jgi:hypothetical protein
MTTSVEVPVFQHKLYDRAVHIDFLRLRCGSEETFADGIRSVRDNSEDDDVHPFISFSEWDALLVVPCSRLYPKILTDIYANRSVAESVSGTAGYFAYLWQNTLNENWRETLTHMEHGGPTVLVSLRFADWFREDVGLGAEILFGNYVYHITKGLKGFRAVIAHSLGWNDVILLLHADTDQSRLLNVVTELRLTTLHKFTRGRRGADLAFSQDGNTQVFAASYTHLLGGFQEFTQGRLSLGTLARKIQSARLLARVAPAHEQDLRKFLHGKAEAIGVAVVDSEMGHYSLSVDMSNLAKSAGAVDATRFIAETRSFIGSLNAGTPDSYTETTSILRFDEPPSKQPGTFAPLTNELRRDIRNVEELLETVPRALRELGASPMTTHRFVAVLNMLLDHLFDPVRSSVVRHLSRFATTLPNRIRGLASLDGIDDLCHVLEYALGQATDGIAQFQHDANALGLSGRGGYSRLITAVEWYIRSAFIGLGIYTELPLITFGLRTGNAGSTGRYQIDIPFNILFVPSRWHIILHEIGHVGWLHMFGWMMESLFIYRAMEREIEVLIERRIKKSGKRGRSEAVPRTAKEQTHVEFLRTRELVKELFPSYVMFALSCSGEIKEFDALALRPTLKAGHESSLSRELLVRVVTHCLLTTMQRALDLDNRRARRLSKPTVLYASERERIVAEHHGYATRSASWWAIWETLSDKPIDAMVSAALSAITDTVTNIEEEERRNATRRDKRRDLEWLRPARLEPNTAAAIHILGTESFRNSVSESLRSVIRVLALRARYFNLESDASVFFGRLLERLEKARQRESDLEYRTMLGRPFAGWLHEGFVLSPHREAFDWSRLLLGSRAELLNGGQGEFLRSQLSPLLAMWHDAVTERTGADGRPPREYEELQKTLMSLDVVRTMEMTLHAPSRTRKSRKPSLVSRALRSTKPRKTHSTKRRTRRSKLTRPVTRRPPTHRKT